MLEQDRVQEQIRQHIQAVDMILTNEVRGEATQINWSLSHNQFVTTTDPVHRLSFAGTDGGLYLNTRQLITRATWPGQLGTPSPNDVVQLKRCYAVPIALL